MLDCHQMYFYPWGTHISWSTPSALLLIPYSVGRFHPRTSFFAEIPVIFIIMSPKGPLFVSKHPKFSSTCHQKTPFSLKTPRPPSFCSLPVDVCLESHMSCLVIFPTSCRVNDRAVHAVPFARKAFRVNYTQLYRA